MNTITNTNVNGHSTETPRYDFKGRDDDSPRPYSFVHDVLGSEDRFRSLSSLQKNRFTHWKPVAPPADYQLPARSMAARVFSWIANTRLSVWATVNLMRSTRFWMLMGAPSKNSRSQIDLSVDRLSGSMHLSKCIHAISPAVAQWVQKELIALNLHESVNQFLKDEHWTLQTFVDVLIPAIYVNIANTIMENANIDDGSEMVVVTLEEVVAFVCEIIEVHLPYINARYDVDNSISDPVRRERKLRHLFTPMVEDFLTVALPEGVKELPLIQVPWVSEMFWASIKKRIVPTIFIEVYRQLVTPLKENKRDHLMLKPGGDSLAAVARMAGDKAAESLPLFIAGARTEFGENGLVDIEGTPVVSVLIKLLTSNMQGSDQLKNWLAGWFAEQLAAIGQSKDVHLNQMWKFLGGYVEPMLVHIFDCMSHMPETEKTPDGRVPDVLGLILIRFFSITSAFFNLNHKTIKDRIEVLRRSGERGYEDPVLLEIFKPYAHDLLEVMGLLDPNELPLPSFIRETVVDHLKEIAPGFLLRQYFAITDSKIDDGITKRKLRNLLLDPHSLEDPSISLKVISALYSHGGDVGADLFNTYYCELWNESGTERVARTFEEMCGKIGKDIYRSVLSHFGISAQELLHEDINPFMMSLESYIVRLIKTALLDTLIHVTESIEPNTDPDVQHPKYLAAAHVMVRLTKLIGKSLAGIEEKLNAARSKYAGNNLKIAREELLAFAQLAADLHAFGGINPFKHLPLNEFPGGEGIKSMLWSTIKEVVLPDLSLQTYVQTTKWKNSLKDSYQKLEDCFHTTHPSWACRILAQYATDYIRHYLSTSSDEASKLLVESMGSFFELPTLTPEERQEKVEPFVGSNIKAFASSQEPEIADLWHALTKYNEAVIAKFFSELSKTIHTIEESNPDFMVDVLIQIIKDATEHFSLASRAAEEAGEDYIYKVKPAQLYATFGTRLHDGVPLDPDAPEAIKYKTRMEGFFMPMAAKLLKLANLSGKDLPMPAIFQQQVGDLLLDEILPMALLQAYKNAMEPHVRDSLMLHFVQTLYAALNAHEEEGINEPIEEEASFIKPDEKTKHLYDTCGELVLELIKLVPDTSVQYVLMKEKVKNMSAETIGNALMPYFSQRTLIQMIDMVIFSGLPSFHPSRWEGKLGSETLAPRKAFLRPDGKMELRAVKKFKFDFAETSYDAEIQRKIHDDDAAAVREALQDKFTKTISQQLHARAWEIVKSIWTGLQGYLSDVVEALFPEKGPKFKSYADRLFGIIFFDIIGGFLQIAAAPMINAFKYVVERVLIDRRSVDVINNIESEFLENLVYKWTDTIIDSLLKHRTC